jgi:hypothetical protein
MRLPFRKEVTLIGDMLGAERGSGVGGAWLRTSEGLRYRMGARDSIGAIAQRYLGSVARAADILALQSREARRAIGPGSLLEMPAAAARTAYALGLIADRDGAQDLGDMLNVYWPSDVDAIRAQVDADMEALSASFYSCAQTATDPKFPVLYDQWSHFYAAWQDEKKDTGVFGSAGRVERAEAYKAKAAQFQASLVGLCKGAVGPEINPPDKNPSDWSGAVKWGAIAVAALAVVYVIGPYARAFAPRRLA